MSAKQELMRARSSLVQSAPEAAVARGQTAMQIQGQYVTAVQVQRPRVIADVTRRIVDECTAAPADMLYRFTVNSKEEGKRVIEGPSIEMTMTMIREYGNCFCEPKLIEETDTHWVFDAVVVDLETGFTLRRQFRQRKNVGDRGKFDSGRLEENAFLTGQSKALRKAITDFVPKSITQAATKAVKEALAKDMQSGQKLSDRIAKCIEVYELDLKVNQAALEEKVGRLKAKWSPQDVVALLHTYQAIKAGQTTVDDEFNFEPPAAPQEREPGQEG